MSKNSGKKMPASRILCGILVAVLCAFASPCQAASGDRITMSFSNAPVGHILQSLGKVYGANFSISSDAGGRTVSIEFTDVTFDEAVEMIESSAGITIDKTGNNRYVVKISAASEAAEEEKTMRSREDRLNNSIMEIVDVRYVNVEDVEKAISAVLGEENKNLVSVKQLASHADRNYNSLVLYGANTTIISNVKKLISTLDVKKPMVEIKALFVELSIDDEQSKGFDWTIMKEPLNFAETGDDRPTGGTSLFNMKFGEMVRTTPLQVETTLKHLSTNGRSKLLADPSIRVMSGRKAIFASEQQVPIMTRNSDGEVNTDWKNVGISLEILPVVMEGDKIHLRVAPRASSIIGEKTLGDTVAPVIAERKTESEIMMNVGETMIIGGLMSDREVKSMSKVPLLGDIPLIGELFKSRTNKREKSTVMIILYPTVVDLDGTRKGLASKDEELKKILGSPDGLPAKASIDGKPLPAEISAEVNERLDRMMNRESAEPPSAAEKKPVPAPVQEKKPASPESGGGQKNYNARWNELVEKYDGDPGTGNTQIEKAPEAEKKQPAPKQPEKSPEKQPGQSKPKQPEQEKKPAPAPAQEKKPASPGNSGGTSWAPPID